MTPPKPKRAGLPPLIVEMRWQDGKWWWCDVRMVGGPRFEPLSAYHRDIGYARVKYIPAPRASGRRKR